MNRRDRGRRSLVVGLAIALAVAAGAVTSAARSARSIDAASPATSTAALNAQYTACLRSNGATWTPIAHSGGFFRVDIPAAANARCAGLDLAREAAADGNAGTAAWLARNDAAPASFWACVGAAGFHVGGGAGQRSDYASDAFARTAQACAEASGTTLPTP